MLIAIGAPFNPAPEERNMRYFAPPELEVALEPVAINMLLLRS